ncbi:hypothetical protein AVEN_219225-1 [Araneus ventricosus]|uniref:Uncharacterized protein n=1 Tax=Araneus ventricosus TaxID=182803 RepID=A0A4Y2VK24_ARAVE|nr:hypothetical protein AVEN_219225-1 [Araneus ventricosus]
MIRAKFIEIFELAWRSGKFKHYLRAKVSQKYKRRRLRWLGGKGADLEPEAPVPAPDSTEESTVYGACAAKPCITAVLHWWGSLERTSEALSSS